MYLIVGFHLEHSRWCREYHWTLAYVLLLRNRQQMLNVMPAAAMFICINYLIYYVHYYIGLVDINYCELLYLCVFSVQSTMHIKCIILNPR